jgi:hypothetical protein
MIRSVLIVGGPREETNVTKFVGSNFLEYSHVLYPPGGGRPLPDHDALITVVTACSHELSALAREAYRGKPQYVITHGVSNIKDQFLTDVFGLGVYRKLTDLSTMLDEDGNTRKGGAFGDYFHLRARIYWLFGRFLKRGTVISRAETGKRIDSFFGIDKGAISIGLMAQAEPDCMENTKRGEYIFHGIPSHYRKIYDQFLIPFKNEWFIDYRVPKDNVQPIVVYNRSKMPETPEDHHTAQVAEAMKLASSARVDDVVTASEALKTIDRPMPLPPPPPPPPPPITTTTGGDDSDMTAQLELLLESMAKQQEQIADLARMEERVREVIQVEIRGVTKLVSDIIPQLQGLTPDQLDKVTQMIGLMLSMNQPRRV